MVCEREDGRQAGNEDAQVAVVKEVADADPKCNYEECVDAAYPSALRQQIPSAIRIKESYDIAEEVVSVR